MYYPYFRGKQFDLLAIKESAEIIASAGFHPIIEPVKESLGGIERCISALNEASGQAILIANPKHGDYKENNSDLHDFLHEKSLEYDSISVGILLTEDMSSEYALTMYNEYYALNPVFIHDGFQQAKLFSQMLERAEINAEHIFIEEQSGKIYRRNFTDYRRILVRDGFEKRTNRKHPDDEFFSDLHLTYSEEGAEGFGDFLTVGDDYSESGGPAYAVAIHITYINSNDDDIMYVRHFKSDRQDSPSDPAGKFLEALEKLVTEAAKPDTMIPHTQAINEFKELYDKGHYPGLGYIKKVSMKHHLQLVASFYGVVD